MGLEVEGRPREPLVLEGRLRIVDIGCNDIVFYLDDRKLYGLIGEVVPYKVFHGENWVVEPTTPEYAVHLPDDAPPAWTPMDHKDAMREGLSKRIPLTDLRADCGRVRITVECLPDE